MLKKKQTKKNLSVTVHRFIVQIPGMQCLVGPTRYVRSQFVFSFFPGEELGWPNLSLDKILKCACSL